jgi:RNA polymerase sigma-70 factor (ECF subfamily)
MQEGSPNFDELMRRARDGDRRAYADLLRGIAPLLRAFIGRRVSAAGDVDDIVQDILLSIHRAGHTYDSDRPFKVWMFAIARHRLNDYLRARYRSAKNLPAVPLDRAGEIAAEDVTEGAELREYLLMMLDMLPEKQRRIVTMMKLEGRPAQEVAAALGMSVSAVKVAAHRAYKALALQAESGEP